MIMEKEMCDVMVKMMKPLQELSHDKSFQERMLEDHNFENFTVSLASSLCLTLLNGWVEYVADTKEEKKIAFAHLFDKMGKVIIDNYISSLDKDKELH